jgi:hypothetical protein
VQARSSHHPGSRSGLRVPRTRSRSGRPIGEGVDSTHRQVSIGTENLPNAEASAAGQNDRQQAGENTKSLTHGGSTLLEFVPPLLPLASRRRVPLRSRNKAMRPAGSLFSSVVKLSTSLADRTKETPVSLRFRPRVLGPIVPVASRNPASRDDCCPQPGNAK